MYPYCADMGFYVLLKNEKAYIFSNEQLFYLILISNSIILKQYILYQIVTLYLMCILIKNKHFMNSVSSIALCDIITS